MHKNIIIIAKTIPVLAILALGGYLRWQHYASVPLPGQSGDEYSYSWVGLSLIKLGMPVGVSGISGYPTIDYRYINVDRVFQETAGGNPMAINYPWFDHPPGLGLITGGFAALKGAQVFEDTTAVIIRKPMLAMGVLAIALVFGLAAVHYGYGAGLIAAAIYATTPLIVVSSRMIQGENAVLLFMLGTLICVSRYCKTADRKWWYAAATIAGLGLMFKLSGIASVIAAGLVILQKLKNDKKRLFQDEIILGVIALAWLGLYVGWGYVYDSKIFWQVVLGNAHRFYGIGMAAFYNLLTEAKITSVKTLTDGWPMALWISWLVKISSQKKSDSIIDFSVLAYLMVYILLGSFAYGWYALPFWPLLTVSLAGWLTGSIKEAKTLAPKLLILAMPTTLLLTKLISIEKMQSFANIWRWGISGLLIFAVWLSWVRGKEKSRLAGGLWIILLVIAVYLNIRYVRMIDVDYWYKVN